MKLRHAILAAAVVLAGPALAQTTTETKVDTDHSMHDGVATTKRTTTHVTKHKTRQPKKVLGVKVGHKTAETKTVRETKVSSDGDYSTRTKTSN